METETGKRVRVYQMANELITRGILSRKEIPDNSIKYTKYVRCCTPNKRQEDIFTEREGRKHTLCQKYETDS
jgi:hypothetical protein